MTMNKDQIRNQILDSLELVGVSIMPEEVKMDNDINIQSYLSDSLMFLSVIVQLEQDLEIEFEEEYLNWEMLSSLNALTDYTFELKNTNM